MKHIRDENAYLLHLKFSLFRIITKDTTNFINPLLDQAYCMKIF